MKKFKPLANVSYDPSHYEKKEEIKLPPPPPVKCEHIFENEANIIKDYDPEICNWVIEHGKQGYYIEAFQGKYNVSVDAMMDWLSSPKGQFEDFKNAFKISISASLYYWNQELIHALDNMDTCADKIPHIRSILADIMKSTPKALREMQFNNLRPKTAQEIADEQESLKQKEFIESIQGTGHGK
jgi:hypothetical protein